MNYKVMCRFFSMVCLAETVFLLPPIGISIFDGTHASTLGFAITVAISALLCIFFKLLSNNATGTLYAKEGFVCVSASWILISLVGCLPFVISGEIPHFVDALFEIVSGFTTTGASILSDVESLSRAALYWRSFSHWVGGMGVLVFLLAIAPGEKRSSGFTMHLFRAESPGPEVGKLVPKMRQTALFLYVIYIVLTILNFIFLSFGDMDAFEAFCTALGTAGTGGFGVKNDSIASYSPYIQYVTTVFMLLFGVNFSCYYLLLLKQVKAVLRDEELRLYVGIVVSSILVITLHTFFTAHMYSTFEETFRHAAFQVASVISTTGYSTTNFDMWPSVSKGILMLLMFTGACAGSTCGGIKCGRILLLFKSLRRNIHQLVHPQQVQVIRVNGNAMGEKVVANTNAYLSAYMIILLVSFILVSFDGFSLMTNFSAVLSCFNNIGPGFEAVGPMENFGGFGVLSKIVLIFDMLAGRLEIFPMLLTFSRSVWKRN
ncbi:MAG: TrkH family potassium uptake protein [Ruminococcaceae bacterium]|nr:TrkH family potassium uptake protein [Oscillospiraceae bacterium]